MLVFFAILPFMCNAFLRPPPRAVIAVDIDEVLANFVPSLVEFHNQHYNTTLTIDDFSSYFYHDVWGGSIDESNEKMMNFYRSPFFKKITPIPNAKEVLLSLKNNFDLHIVTARPLHQEHETRNWINTHYKGIFKSIQFGNHFVSNGNSRSKPSMCRDINAFLLIDDSYVYAKQCVESEINVILFGDYPWNSFVAHESIPRAKDWTTVHEKVLSIYALSHSKRNEIKNLNKIALSSFIIIVIGFLFKI